MSRNRIHADPGSSMTSKPVAFLLADLGVTQCCASLRMMMSASSELVMLDR
jgi:hypothetical protein